MQRFLLCLAFALTLALTCRAQEPPDKCTEYLPRQTPCKVTISIPDTTDNQNPAPTHADVTISPNSAAAIVLTTASPLMKCTVAATPAALARDASSSITTFLGSIAGLGALSAGVLPAQVEAHMRNFAVSRAQTHVVPGFGAAAVAARDIDSKLADLERLRARYESAFRHFEQAKQSIKDHWKYSYATDGAFAAAAASMFGDLKQFETDKLPGSDDMDKSVGAVADALVAFKNKYSDAKTGQLKPMECQGDQTCIQEFRDWFDEDSARLVTQKEVYALLQLPMQFLLDAQSKFKPPYIWLYAHSTPEGSGEFVPVAAHPWTTIDLPMTPYAQKQVTETVTCKDVATQNPVFDNITFSAYYERNPSWDLSAGAVISLVPGHQVGPITPPLPDLNTANPVLLGITSQSAVQFVPAAIFEFHPSHYLNFRCPWAHDGTGDHPWGYVCTFGPAVGFLINPNNGTTSAEFFEGVSFGIHRLSFLIGNHTGRFQQFGEGYYVGEMVPAGTTPPTTRRWTNHPAFGITYRIPIR